MFLKNKIKYKKKEEEVQLVKASSTRDVGQSLQQWPS